MKTFAQFKKEVSKKANFEFFTRLGMDIYATIEKDVTYYAIVCQKNRDELENKNLYTLYVYYCLTSEWIESEDLYFDDAHEKMVYYCDFE